MNAEREWQVGDETHTGWRVGVINQLKRRHGIDGAEVLYPGQAYTTWVPLTSLGPAPGSGDPS